MADLSEFFTVAQAAEYLGLSGARVRVFLAEGRFEGATQVGSLWLIPKQAVYNFAKRKRPPHRPPKKSR